MNLALHAGEAGRIGGQSLEPLVLAFGQHSSRLLGDHCGRWRHTTRRAVALFLSLLRCHRRRFRIKVDFHR